MSNPKRFDNEFENISNPQQEQEGIDEIADITSQLLHKRYPKPDKILRGVHPKSHGCVKARFEINADIPAQYQIGLFSQPARCFDAIIRFSNAAALVRPDIDAQGNHGSRGMAIKVFDVEGEVLYDDDGDKNQDFLMINQPEFAFANIKDYLRLNRILLKNNDDPTAFFTDIEGLQNEDLGRLQRTGALIQKIQQTAIANPLNVSYFGAAPFKFGAGKVMRFCVKPQTPEPSPPDVPQPPADNYLREAVTTTMNEPHDLVFDFCVQVRSDGDDLHIEDASQSWDEQHTPFVCVAKITIPAPQQDVNSIPSWQECEALFFTPWHSLTDHQPLGGINRLRQAVYVASATTRKAKEFNLNLIERILRFFGLK